jgi:hypothetical protein
MARSRGKAKITVAESVVDTVEVEPVYAVRPERMAWGVLLIAFAAFCVICGALTIGVHFFMFESSVAFHVVLQTGRGTPGVTSEGNTVELNVRDSLSLSRGMTVRTGEFDQAVMRFEDRYQNDRIIATVVIKHDSAIRLRSASMPRFGWSSGTYQIDLTDLRGEVEIIVTMALSRDLVLNVMTPQGALVRIGAGGRYTLNSFDSQVQVTNWEGEVVAVPPNTLTGTSIGVGRRGLLNYADGSLNILPAQTNLVVNGALEPFTDAEGNAVSNRFAAWSCANGGENPPRGSYEAVTGPNRVTALHLLRGDGAISSDRTGCQQITGSPGTGYDVSGFNYLEFTATVYIASQSLQGCGEKGTECPLMMRVDFISEDGGERSWIHGLYARPLEPTTPWLPRCDECPQDHVRIYEDVWYTYESGNLFDFFQQPLTRPAAITRVYIYASGHQYDVYVSNVALFAANTATDVVDADELGQDQGASG